MVPHDENVSLERVGGPRLVSLFALSMSDRVHENLFPILEYFLDHLGMRSSIGAHLCPKGHLLLNVIIIAALA